MALEEEGKIEDAISAYEESIALGYNADHANKRLMVLYRKAKDAKNEIRVIHRALEVFGEYPEYVERLKNAPPAYSSIQRKFSRRTSSRR